MSSKFDDPARKLTRAVFDLRNATESLFASLPDEEGVYEAEAALARAQFTLSVAKARLSATTFRSKFLSMVVTATQNSEAWLGEIDDPGLAQLIRNVAAVPAQAPAVLALAQQVCFLWRETRSLEIKSSVNDEFSFALLSWGGAQLLFRRIKNLQFSDLLREEFVVARPAGRPLIFVDDWQSTDPFVFPLQQRLKHAVQNWPIVARMRGDQLFNDEAQVDLETVDMSALRNLVGLPELADVNDDALRLLIELAFTRSEALEYFDGEADPELLVPVHARVSASFDRELVIFQDSFYPFDDLVELCMAMHSLVPAPVAFEIFEFLDNTTNISRFAKMRVIEGTFKSIARVYEERNVKSKGKKRSVAGISSSSLD
jgi:hypothetical protein